MLFSLFIVTSLTFRFTISQDELGIANKLNESFTDDERWISGRFADPNQLDPAGRDFTGTLYVARAQVNGQWVPGKGFYNGKTFYVVVPYDHREILSLNNQAFIGGNTRWFHLHKRCELPSSAVLAGYDPHSNRPEYVCRGQVFTDGKPWMLVGKYVPDLFACRVPYYGEIPVFSFEVLIEAYNGVK